MAIFTEPVAHCNADCTHLSIAEGKRQIAIWRGPLDILALCAAAVWRDKSFKPLDFIVMPGAALKML